MQEGSSRSTTTPRRARTIGAGVIVVIILAVFAGVSLRGRGPRSDPWTIGYESVDTAVMVRDSAQIRHDLATPVGATSSLRLDCEIGRRDAARLLSHREPSNATLRRAYRKVLQENWRLYANCAIALSRGASASVVTSPVKSELSLLRRDERGVNAVAHAVSYAPVFTSLP